MEKNLIGKKGSYSQYNKYYGSFRGVDFTSDHTQVDDNRFAYLCNMYKDYGSAQGQAVETVPGYRRRVVTPEGERINGIHVLTVGNATSVLIHAGTKLYKWYNYPLSVGVDFEVSKSLPEETEVILDTTKVFELTLDGNVDSITSVKKETGEDISENCLFDAATKVLTVARSDLSHGDTVYITYKEGSLSAGDALFSSMQNRESGSFTFADRLYLIDGANYLVYNGTTVVDATSNAYVPTTFINIIPSGENADAGTEYEQRNLLTPKFRNTFIADGTTTEYYLNLNGLSSVDEVKVYGIPLTVTTDYTVDLVNGKVTFTVAPTAPENTVMSGTLHYPEGYAGVEITASKAITKVSGVGDGIADSKNIIKECTLACVFDNRVFLSGNPHYKNHIFYCARNSEGYADPTYFGVLNYAQDGVGSAGITGMVPVADTLTVLKSDTTQEGSVFFHNGKDTGNDLLPRIYPSVQGLAGIGCLGACCNFLDDPVFVSRFGLEAVGQLSTRLERAIEHRSSLVDAKLTLSDLSGARLCEWNGYLVLLTGGNLYLADSRQTFRHPSGNTQYEWYYLEDMAVYEGQYDEFVYDSSLWEELTDAKVHYCVECKTDAEHCECGAAARIVELPLSIADAVYDEEDNVTRNLCGTTANEPDEDGEETGNVLSEVLTLTIDGAEVQKRVFFRVTEHYDEEGMLTAMDAYLCKKSGAMIGGVKKKAVTVSEIAGNLFFGTENGVLCSFNFDRRNAEGEIPAKYYSFDGRTIFCGCATKMDSCGVPHLIKNTVKKSTVVKTKAMTVSAAKVKVRTNVKPYNQIARINATRFSFEEMDFEDFSFETEDETLFAVREKEKKWVEKQYYVYSDEFCKPFSLFYIAYRYIIKGRYKGGGAQRVSPSRESAGKAEVEVTVYPSTEEQTVLAPYGKVFGKVNVAPVQCGFEGENAVFSFGDYIGEEMIL